MSFHPGCARPHRRALLRSSQPDSDEYVVAGASGRCRLLRLAASRAGLRSGDGGRLPLRGRTAPGRWRLRCSFCAIPADFRTANSGKTRDRTAFCRSVRAEIHVQLVATQSHFESAGHRMDRRSHSRTRSGGQDFAARLLEAIPTFRSPEKTAGTQLLKIGGLKARLLAPHQLSQPGFFFRHHVALVSRFTFCSATPRQGLLICRAASARDTPCHLS
jgi:hypothetical protein